jgi:hypothetical protein
MYAGWQREKSYGGTGHPYLIWGGIFLGIALLIVVVSLFRLSLKLGDRVATSEKFRHGSEGRS